MNRIEELNFIIGRLQFAAKEATYYGEALDHDSEFDVSGICGSIQVRHRKYAPTVEAQTLKQKHIDLIREIKERINREYKVVGVDVDGKRLVEAWQTSDNSCETELVQEYQDFVSCSAYLYPLTVEGMEQRYNLCQTMIKEYKKELSHINSFIDIIKQTKSVLEDDRVRVPMSNIPYVRYRGICHVFKECAINMEHPGEVDFEITALLVERLAKEYKVIEGETCMHGLPLVLGYYVDSNGQSKEHKVIESYPTTLFLHPLTQEGNEKRIELLTKILQEYGIECK